MANIQATKIVSDPSEIEQLLTRYSAQIASDFNQEPRIGKYVDRFQNLRNGYYLKLAVRGDWKMTRFCGPAFKGNSDELLDIVVFSPHTGVDQVAGRLIEVGGEIEVVHNGRVNQSDGRSKPFLLGKENVIDVEGKPFFRLGPLRGADTFDNIVAYHESRLVLGESPTPEQIADDSYKGDGGPSASGKRSAGIWEARHSPLWTAFLNCIGEVEGLPTPACKPDCWFKLDGKKVLVEVKPDSSLQSITTAVGQLILYERICGGADIRVLVSPSFSGNRFKPKIDRVLRDYNIRHVECVLEASNYSFHGLEALHG